MRRILTPALALAFILLAGPAHAQFAIYATSSNLHASGVETGTTVSATGLQTHTTSFVAPGIGGGVTFNFLPLGPVSLGLDVRGSTKPGTTGADTVLGGLKLGFHPPLLPIKPYLQASAGYLATRTANISTDPIATTFTNRYVAYEVLAGVDYSILPFIDLRLGEVGGGKAYNTGFSFNNAARNPTLVTFNTGVVFHF